jgi:hypothetical protein
MLSQKKSSLTLDEDANLGSFGLKINSTSYAVYINGTQNMGVGTNTLANKLSLKCAPGDGIRITDSISNGYGNILVGANGSLHLSSSSNWVSVDSNINIGTYDGITNGLFLDGQLIKASAQELNYTHEITPGFASADKVLVCDINTDIAGINSLSTSTPILPTSGGTGVARYNKGDLLVATSATTLGKLSLPVSNNYMLQSDNTSTSGVSWAMGNISLYQFFDAPAYVSSTSYTFGKCFSMDSTYQYNINVRTNINVNLTTTGVNGIDISATSKTGAVYPDPTTTTLIGNGSTFTTDLSIGDIISISREGSMGTVNELKKVVSIASNTSLTIDAPFTLMNKWTLGTTGIITTTAGLMKFGSGAFSGTNSTTTKVTMTIGSPNLNFAGTLTAWTLEFFVRINALSAQTICASNTINTFRLSMATNGALTLFLGQGTTFNIANGSAIIGNLTALTFFHIAIVFNGSNYSVYKNGTNSLTVTSALKLSASAFNTFIFGGSAANFNGQLDEIRISSIARYSTAFIPPTSAFTTDGNTLCLNHFDNSASVTTSDDTSNGYLSYFRGGGMYSNTVYYGYIISNINSSSSGYILSANATQPELPSGYTLYASIPYFIPVNSATIPYAAFYNTGNYICFGTPIVILTGATNVTPTIQSTSLSGFISLHVTSIDLLITHTHVGNISCGITIGNNALNLLRTVLTLSLAGTQQLQLTLPLITNSIDSYLTAAASTTSYSIAIIGVRL